MDTPDLQTLSATERTLFARVLKLEETVVQLTSTVSFLLDLELRKLNPEKACHDAASGDCTTGNR